MSATCATEMRDDTGTHLPRHRQQLRPLHCKAWPCVEQGVELAVELIDGPMLELVPDVDVAARAAGQQGQVNVVARPEEEVRAIIACVHESSDSTIAAASLTAARGTRALRQLLGELHALRCRRSCRELAGELEQRSIQVEVLVEPVLPWTPPRKQQLARLFFHFIARRVDFVRAVSRVGNTVMVMR